MSKTAGNSITVEVDLSKFTSEMGKLKSDLPRITREIIKQLMLFTEGRMALRAPVDTGFLRSSIETKFPSMMEAFVTPTAEYAIWVELTWKKRNYGGFHIPSKEGYVADSYQDLLRECEKKVNEVLIKELK